MRKFMKLLYYILFIQILTSCNFSETDNQEFKVNSNKIHSDINHRIDSVGLNSLIDTSYNETETFYVIVADTSNDYYLLHSKMVELNSKLKTSIDTLGRFYNKSKNLIALPEDDEDESYAGQYFPRRFPSESLSLEYLDFYQENAGEKTIALVCGIYDSLKSADSALTILKTMNAAAFKIKANIYVGCIH